MSKIYPWVANLSKRDRLEFHVRLLSCVVKSIIINDWANLGELLEDWRATAEAAVDPDMLVLLQDNDSPEEYIALT